MAKRVFEYKGEFDASSILASLKQIRDQAEKSNISDKLLGSYDKDLAKIEKLTTQYLAQIQKGFTKDSDVKSFSRILEQLENAYSVIAVRAEQFGDVSNFSTQTKEVKALAAQLKSITSEEAKLTKAAEDYIQAKGTELKLNKSEIEGLKKSVKEAEALREKIDEITAAKKAAAQQSIGRVAIQSEAGQAALAEVTHDNFNFSVASRKTPDKERRSLVRGSGDAAHFNTPQAQATAMKEYNRILEETMTSGKTASDAIEAFTEIMKHYRLELTNADEIQKNFEEDMAKIGQTAITNKDALSPGDKTKVTKATNTIERADQISGIADASAVTNLQQQIQALVTITQNLAAAQAAAAANAERNAAETSKGMTNAAGAIKGVVAQDKEELKVKEEQIEAQAEFNQTFERLSNGVKQLLSIGSAFRQIRQVIKQTYDDVKNLDKSFAEIAMVTSYSVEDMWSMYPQYQEMANRLGQTTQSVVQASGLFYQQGLDTAEALQLTEDTMKLATLAGLDFKDATSQMTAALRAFHMDMSEGAHVTDVYAEIAAHAAVDVAGLSDAMSATAAIANSAGMSFENTSAMLATMVEATQEAPKNLGTAMKTIIARFTELKENVAGTADSEFDDLDYNKVDKALKSVGVSLKDTNGQFRNMDDVFLELSEKWNTLDRNTQRYIATTAAGSRQQSRFIALMENYDRTMQLIEVAQDSAGKSSEQFAKYQDTLEYKVTQLKNSWEALRMSFTDSAFFKGVVGQIGDLVSTISKFDKKQVLSIGLIGMTLGKSIITNLIKSFKDGTSSISTGLHSVLDTVTETIKKQKINISTDTFQIEGEEITNLEQVNQKLTEIYGKQINLTNEEAKLVYEYVEEQNNLANISKQLKDNTLSEEKRNQLIEQQNEAYDKQKSKIAALKEKGLNPNKLKTETKIIDSNSVKGIALGGLKSSISAVATAGLITAIGGGDVKTAIKAAVTAGVTSFIPTGMSLLGKAISSPHGAIITAGIAAAAVIGYAIYKHFNKNIETAVDKAEARLESITKRAEEVSSKLEEARSETSEQKKAAEDLEKLQAEYTQLSGKIIKTTEEQEKYNQIVEQIRENYPEIVTSYDETTGKLQVQNDLWDNILEKQKESAKLAAQQQLYLEYASARVNYGQAEAQYDLTNAQLDSQIVTDVISSKVADSLYYNADVNKLVDNLEEVDGLDVEKVAENFSIELDSEESKKDFLEIIAAYNTTNEGLKQIGIDDAQVKRQYVKDNNESIQNQKKTNEEYLKGQEEIYKKQKQLALSQSIQNQYGMSEGTASFMAYMATEGARGRALQSKGSSVAASLGVMQGSRKIDDWKDEHPIATRIARGSLGALGMLAPFIEDDIETFAVGDDLRAWTKLNEQEQKVMKAYMDNHNLLEEYGSYQKAWAELFEKDGEALASISEELEGIGEGIAVEEYEEKLQKEMEENSALIAALDDFEKNRAEYSEQELKNKISEILKTASDDSQIQEGLQNWTQQFIDERQTEIDNIKNMLGGQVTQDLSQYGIEQLKAYEERLQSIIDKYGVSNGQQYDALMNSITKQYHLTAEESSSIFMTDWSAATAETAEEFRGNWIATMEDAGVESAKQIYDEMRPTLEKLGILDLTISNAAEVEAYFDSIREKMSNAFETKDSIFAVIQEQVENGKISLEQYFETVENIKKLNPNAKISDYLTIQDDGSVVANAQALKQIYLDQTKAQLEQIEVNKAKTQAELDSLQNNDIIHDTELQEIDAVLQQLEVQNLLNDALDGQIDKLNEQIDAYNILNGTSFEHVAHGTYDTTKVQETAKGIREEIKKQDSEIVKERIKQLKEALRTYDEEGAELSKLIEAYMKDFSDTESEYLEEMKNKSQEAYDAQIDALKALKDAQDDVIDKQKELNEALYGKDNRNAKSGGLYNYTTLAERYASLADKSKNKLDDLQPGDDANAIMNEYLSNVHKEAVIGESEKAIHQETINRGRDLLNNRLQEEAQKLRDRYGADIDVDMSDLYTFIDGRYMRNDKKINSMHLPEEFKDFIEDTVVGWNKELEEMEKIDEQMEKRQKEFRDMQKKGLSDIVSLQDEMKNTLKEKYEQEIQDLQDKYDAMTDADTDYLDSLEDAIEKERKLREKQNAYDDLAQKEKKLSLMQRDTSGVNQLEVQNLENEIQDDREKLLDDAIDEVIDGLKELYELQQESRDAEIEYRESLLTDAALMREVQEALDGINTADELVQWFYDNTANLSEMSAEQIQLEEMNWKDLFDNKLRYMETSQAQFNEALQVETEEVTTTTENLSQTLTTEAENSLNDITETVNENIKSAKDSLVDALDTLAEKTKAYTDAVNDARKAEEAYTAAKNALLFGDAFSGLSEGLNTSNDDKKMEEKGLKWEDFNGDVDAWTKYQSYQMSQAAQERSVQVQDRKRRWDNEKDLQRTAIKNNAKYYTPGSGSENNAVRKYEQTANPIEIQKFIDAIFPGWQMKATNQIEISDLDQYTKETKKKLFQMLVNFGIEGYLKGNTIYRENPGNGASPFNHDTIPFKTGGLVNYTGPAWVDGSPSRPEAFLSADDTEMIGSLVDLLQELTFTNRSFSNMQMSTVGDTTIELTVNFDSVSEDYDSDRVIELMQQKIVEAANYTGSNVILRKR